MTTRIKLTADDCRTCGACCVSRDPAVLKRYADMTTADVARVSPHVRRQLIKTSYGGEQWLATAGKELADGQYSCRYLRGTPGTSCSCSIYATRPEICQTFKVGGNRCREARAAAREPLVEA